MLLLTAITKHCSCLLYRQQTFVSHIQNALKQNTAAVNSNSLTITVPALSTTAVLLKGIAATLPVNFLSISVNANNNNAQVKLVVA